MLVAIISATSLAKAEKPSFEYSVGAELVSDYVWRGLYNGGLSLQPCVEIGGAGITFGLWGNVGFSDWAFNFNNPIENEQSYFSPELDLYLSYEISGFSVMATYYHYFNTNFFNLQNDMGWDANQLELTASYTVSENIPLTVSWNTVVAGTDGYYTNKAGQYTEPESDAATDSLTLKRAFSSYLEISYMFELPWELSLTATAGISPWRSMYADYTQKFTFNNLNLRLEREFDLNVCTLSAFVQPSINFISIGENKSELWNNNLNCVAGIGIWF